MPGKQGRKRKIAETSGRPPKRPKKRARHTPEYRVKDIIGETQTHYHIDWEPDEESGEVYEPTWEPKENANALAIRDWESRKAPAAKHQTPTSGLSSAAPVRRRGRPTRVVESSPPPSARENDTTAGAGQQVQKELEPVVTEPEADSISGATEIKESQQHQAENVEPHQEATQKTGFVAHSSPPSSYLAGAYEKVVSEPATQDEDSAPSQPVGPAVSGVLQSTADDLEQPAATSTQKSTNSASVVIPDSQSQAASFVESTSRASPPTQHTERTPDEPVIEDPPHFFLEAVGDETQQVSSLAEQSVEAVAESSEPAPVSDNQQDHLCDEGQTQAAEDSNQSLQASSTSRATVQSQAAREEREATPAEELVAAAALPDVRRPRASTTPEPTTAKERRKPSLDPAVTTSDGVLSAASSSSQSRPNGKSRAIVISSIEEQSGQSDLLNFNSSVHDTDFEPPPAAQRPLPSFALDAVHVGPDPVPSRVSTAEPSTQQPSTSRIGTPVRLTQSRRPETRVIHYYGSSQIFPFQTQVQQKTSPKLESSTYYTNTPGSRALFLSTTVTEHRSPSAVSSRSPESTPFPSLPRIPLGSVGESAPPRLSLSSREQSPMNSSSTPKMETLGERMSRAREKREADRALATPVPSVTSSLVDGSVENSQPASALPFNLITEMAVAQAARLGSSFSATHERSPSAVPAVEEVAPITREEMTTSERYETLLPQAQAHAQSSAKAVNQQSGTSTSTGRKPQDMPPRVTEDLETASAHVVPVAPSAHQRDQYQNNIYYEEKLIAQVLNSGSALDDHILAETNKFLERLRQLALHPDLINPETESQTTESEMQAKWDIKSSAKFKFLNEFIASVSDRNLHIAIVAHGDRIPDMLQNFFHGINVPCKRWAHPLSIDPDLSPANLGIKVSIVDLDGGPQNVQSADIVIAMDPSVDYRHPLVRAVRKQTGDQDKWSLLLTLVIPHTLEHIERSLQADLPPLARTRALVKATNECRWNAGRLESTQAPLKDAASAIAGYLDETAAEWPIAGLSQLEELDSQTETDIQADTHGVKRPQEDLEADVAKRARLESPAKTQLPVTINPLELDISHVSDSLGTGIQSNTDIADVGLVCSNTEQRLRENLQVEQDRRDEHVKALEDVQYRNEDLRKHNVELKRELDVALLAATTAQIRMEGAEANNRALRIERTEDKKALAEANARLLSHEVPEVRELEELRMSAQAAKLEEEKAKKKAAAAEKDLEFLRSMYQDSSNRARELAQKNSELEARLASASHIAQGEQARARDVSFRGHNKVLEQDNIRLRTTLENMKLAMKNKDEQIASLREGRGRVGTRGSSVPRSPRMGSPIKGRMSRQASPAAAEVRGRAAHLHPLRNSEGT